MSGPLSSLNMSNLLPNDSLDESFGQKATQPNTILLRIPNLLFKSPRMHYDVLYQI